MVMSFRLQTNAGPVSVAFGRWGPAAVRELPVIGELWLQAYRNHMRHHFDSEGATTGPRWAALSPGYARRKQRLFGVRPIMVRTGEARTAAVRGEGAGALQQVRIAGDSLAVVAGFRGQLRQRLLGHQLGTRHLPRRPIHRWSSNLRERGTLLNSLLNSAQGRVVGALRGQFAAALRDGGPAAALPAGPTR